MHPDPGVGATSVAGRPAETFRDLQGIAVYTSCPASNGEAGPAYLDDVRRVSRWSDDAGCVGMLIYTDNGLVDPWIVAHEVLAATNQLAPLVAVQPLYKHPFAVAKTVASLAQLFRRRVALNFVAGGFPFDLATLGDDLDHDRRYDRLAEYGCLVVDLLRSSEPVTTVGEFYSTRQLRLPLRPPAELMPTVMVSGSSPAGQRCAAKIGAVAVEYPHPTDGTTNTTATAPREADSGRGIRVGVLARDDRVSAWAEASTRFPDDPSGRQMHDSVLAISDSHWHHQLSEPHDDLPTVDGVYWLGPYKTYKTFCPYLVGSYADVGRHLQAYLRAGHRHVILDEPRSRDDLIHALRAFELALVEA